MFIFVLVGLTENVSLSWCFGGGSAFFFFQIFLCGDFFEFFYRTYQVFCTLLSVFVVAGFVRVFFSYNTNTSVLNCVAITGGVEEEACLRCGNGVAYRPQSNLELRNPRLDCFPVLDEDTTRKRPLFCPSVRLSVSACLSAIQSVCPLPSRLNTLRTP